MFLKHRSIKIFFFAFSLLAVLFLVSQTAFAQSEEETTSVIQNLTQPCMECGSCTFEDFLIVFKNMANLGLSLIGPLLVLILIVAGLVFLFSHGNQELVDRGKKIISGALVGMTIVLSAWLIINTVVTVSVKDQKIFGTAWFVYNTVTNPLACPVVEPEVEIATDIQDPTERRVVIDAGHGGKFDGAVGPWRNGGKNDVSPEEKDLVGFNFLGRMFGWMGADKYNQLIEKKITLEIAQRLERLLKADGFEVQITRTGDYHLDSNLTRDLKKRAKIANEFNADIFVSIHLNASEKKIDKKRGIGGGQGTETYYYYQESQPLAKKTLESLVESLGRRNRGAKEGKFAINSCAKMATVLAESVFIDNDTEDKILRTEAFRQKIAEGLFDAIKDYFTATPLEKLRERLKVSCSV